MWYSLVVYIITKQLSTMVTESTANVSNPISFSENIYTIFLQHRFCYRAMAISPLGRIPQLISFSCSCIIGDMEQISAKMM